MFVLFNHSLSPLSVAMSIPLSISLCLSSVWQTKNANTSLWLSVSSSLSLLPVRPSVCLFVCLTVYLSDSLSLFLCLSSLKKTKQTFPYFFLSVCLSFSLSVCSSIYISSISLSVPPLLSSPHPTPPSLSLSPTPSLAPYQYASTLVISCFSKRIKPHVHYHQWRKNIMGGVPKDSCSMRSCEDKCNLGGLFKHYRITDFSFSLEID